MQAYSDPNRETDEHALPDLEVFHSTSHQGLDWAIQGANTKLAHGWYWWSCFPGCLPDGDPIGPFDTEAEALADARAE